MSRHEGVSCDSCLKGNFRGRRYKCLICYDYDLCATCFEAGATTTRHTTDHPMQCILTRSDFDMYYGGEALTAEQPQAFTCPYCCKMGFTDATLHEHVTADHTDVSVEIVCPICASLPGGDPNHVTDDFASHLALEHRTPRDFDEPPGLRHVRRIPHPGRGGSSRTRRGNMHFGSSANTLTGLSPSGRENMDPIADVREWMPELLSQLSSVRNRAAAAQSVSSQLQQLEMQLQSTRQQLERMPRRQAETTKAPAANANPTVANPESVLPVSQNSNNSESQFLLAKLTGESLGSSSANSECSRVERNMFVQELLLSTLTEQLQLVTHTQDPFAQLEAQLSRQPQIESKVEATSDHTVVEVIEQSSKVAARDNVGGLKSESKSGSCGVTAASTGSAGLGSKSSMGSSPSGNGSTSVNSRPAVGQTLAVQANLQVDGRAPLTGACASASGAGSPSTSPLPHSMPHTSRPPLLAAAMPAPPLPPQPQGSTVNLNEHAMSVTSTPPRPAGAMSSRDANRLNPAAAKRSMLKHLPASRGTTDMDPPPH